MAVPKNSRNLEFTAECGSQPPAYAQCVSWPPASSSYMERSFHDPAPDLRSGRRTSALIGIGPQGEIEGMIAARLGRLFCSVRHYAIPRLAFPLPTTAALTRAPGRPVMRQNGPRPFSIELVRLLAFSIAACSTASGGNRFASLSANGQTRTWKMGRPLRATNTPTRIALPLTPPPQVNGHKTTSRQTRKQNSPQMTQPWPLVRF
jgi:hypothetical protein